MYVPTGGSPPSAQAQELGQRLYEVVDQYRRDHPGIATSEVGDAFKIGWGLVRSGPGASDSTQRSLVAVMLGLAIAGAAAALFMTGGFPGMTSSPVFVVLGVLGAIAVVAAIAKSSSAGPGRGAQSIAVVIGLILLALVGLFLLLARSGGGPLG